MKSKYIIGYWWVFFGIASFLSSGIKGINFHNSKIDYSEGLFKKMPHTIDLLKGVESYSDVLLIFFFLLSSIAIYVGFSYLQEKQWATQAVIYLSNFYILLLSISVVFMFMLFQKISIDLEVPFLGSGIIKSSTILSLFFIPFILSIYFTKKGIRTLQKS